jgi:hypothetical protein
MEEAGPRKRRSEVDQSVRGDGSNKGKGKDKGRAPY